MTICYGGLTILAGIGFTAGGVLAGSIAAASQALIGNVAAGSLFAICQSIGAAGFSFPFMLLVSGVSGFIYYFCGGTKKNKHNDRYNSHLHTIYY